MNDSDNARLANAFHNLVATGGAQQRLGDLRRGARQIIKQFGVSMQIVTESDQLVQMSGDPIIDGHFECPCYLVAFEPASGSMR